MEMKICLFCKKEYQGKIKSKFCSFDCFGKNEKGKKLSEKHKLKLGLAKIGEIPGNRKNKKASKETREKISKALLGREVWNKGLKFPEKSGENHPRWIKDRTQVKKQEERNNANDKHWKYIVYKRDGFKCKINSINCNGRLEAHHILSWIDYPELRYEINNGITLCLAHHPRKRAEEKRLIPYFMGLVPVSTEKFWTSQV